ncbi:unnamed protein product, partial [Staurois parvus]
CKRHQAGRVNNNRAGSTGGQAENGRWSQARIKQEKSAEVLDQAGSARIRQGQDKGCMDIRYRAQEKKHTPRQRNCRSGHPLNTPA